MLLHQVYTSRPVDTVYHNSTELYKKMASTVLLSFAMVALYTEVITLANKIHSPMNILYIAHKPTSVRNKPGYIRTAAVGYL